MASGMEELYRLVRCVVILLVVCAPCEALLCFNGTFESEVFGDDPLRTWDWLQSARDKTRTRCRFTIRCEEGALCFVRAWAARGRHAWLVQRGCYAGRDDPLAGAGARTRRRLPCRRERLAEAEYTVCLCRGDLCNAAARAQPRYVALAMAGLLVAAELHLRHFE